MILENAIAFPSCGVDSREIIQCPGENPQAQSGEEAHRPPRRKQVTRAESACRILKPVNDFGNR
ncbi:hypothetical protein [Cytobacillus oceanisediminis]|uniref:hypothetical protein n=1 Tax=Cytobacillus oceanisediminis TaxID=665099 RepID=UPI000DE985BC|nr:hypothetical protein [Cytobacillus oceanisediminis]